MLTTALFLALALFGSQGVNTNTADQDSSTSATSEAESERIKTSDKHQKAVLDFIKG